MTGPHARWRPKLGRRRTHGATTLIARCALAAALLVGGGAQGETDSASTADVKSYCAHIAVAASDARIAWQTDRLNQLEARIKARIAELDGKTAELRDWIARRQALEQKASEKLVGIYAKMRPETAATQISTLDDDMAAAVLSGLNARQASAIFNELVPDRAAKLATLMTGAASADKTAAASGKKL